MNEIYIVNARQPGFVLLDSWLLRFSLYPEGFSFLAALFPPVMRSSYLQNPPSHSLMNSIIYWCRLPVPGVCASFVCILILFRLGVVNDPSMFNVGVYIFPIGTSRPFLLFISYVYSAQPFLRCETAIQIHFCTIIE